MKKVFSVFLLALVAAYASADITINFVVDASDRVMVVREDPNASYPNNKDTTYLQAGTTNGFVIKSHASQNYYSYLYFYSANEDAVINSISYVLADVDGTEGDLRIFNSGTNASLYPGATYDGATFTITTASLAESRTAKVSFNIDGDYSRVQVRRSSNNKNVTVNANTFDVWFDPTLETAEQLTIGSTSTLPLYKVTRNGEVLPATSGSYTVTPEDGDQIDIIADTDVRIPFNINLADDTPEDAIEYVSVNGTEEDWTVDGFDVPWGARVIIQYNTDDYKIYVNGTQLNNGYYLVESGTVTNEAGYTFNVVAEEWATYTVTIETEQPDYIAFRDGNGRDVVLEADGTTELSVPENKSSLYISAAENCFIISVVTVLDEVETTVNPSWGSYNVTAVDGLTIRIEAGAIVRDKQFVVYVDDNQYLGNGYIYNSDYDYIGQTYNNTLAAGYNVYNFYDGDNQFYVSIYNTQNSGYWYAAYYNDATYGSAYTNYGYFTFADKDVLKIYLAKVPALCSVEFKQEDFTLENLVKDIIVPVEEDALEEALTDGLIVVEGTQLDFTTNAKYVLANGIAYEADEDGVCHVIVVDEETTITLTDEDPTTATVNAQVAADNNVYTLQGMLLIKNATQAQINALPAGLYIINGKTSYLLQR